ncbi:MAG: ankyrin repeat domain-containing protein [Gammaproteobacteria bacterium]|nr:ankyrin repeat domain-containing protein [Gammaproteobacteria bacterium]
MSELDRLELIRPFELEPEQPKWLNRWLPEDVWNLLVAARTGDVDSVRKLLKKDPSLVHANYWYTSPLRIAAREGNLRVVQELLRHKSIWDEDPIDDRDNVAQIALDHGHQELALYLRNQNSSLAAKDLAIHLAVRQREYETVKTILNDDSPNVDVIGSRAKTPLHYAVENEDIDMIELLVERGAKVDQIAYSSHDRLGTFGFRPVASALWFHGFWRQRNNYEIVKYLVSKGSDYTLPIAAACGDLNRVKTLLSRQDKDPDYAEPSGKRALSAAAERNHLKIVAVLLQQDANPNLPEGPYCPNGYALWSAARFGYKDVVKLLLDHGADPNAEVDSSGSPIEATHDAEIRELLSQRGGRISIIAHFHNKNFNYVESYLDQYPDQLTETAIGQGFAAAVRNSDVQLVNLLLDRGFRVPSSVSICQTYLWFDLELAELLLKNGMDPNLPNWQRVTPLHHMAGQGNVPAAKLFLKYGADPLLVDVEYCTTPLGWAAREGQTDFVKFLLSYDSGLKTTYPSEADEKFTTPMLWASKRGHESIVKLLS